MAFVLAPSQFFFIIIIVFAAIGFYRGWRREIISLAFALGGVLFLYLGGGQGLAQFFFVKVPILLQDLLGTARTTPPSPTDSTIFFTSIVTFIAVIVIGYLVGNRAQERPKTPVDRILGIVPGMVTGYALINYLVFVFAKSPTITFGVITPDQKVVSDYVLVLFLVAVVAVVAGLFMARSKKGSGPVKK